MIICVQNHLPIRFVTASKHNKILKTLIQNLQYLITCQNRTRYNTKIVYIYFIKRYSWKTTRFLPWIQRKKRTRLRKINVYFKLIFVWGNSINSYSYSKFVQFCGKLYPWRQYCIEFSLTNLILICIENFKSCFIILEKPGLNVGINAFWYSK